MMKKGLLLLSACALPASAAVIDFTGPDDLLLDPATNVIAVNTFGTGIANAVTPNLDVNGVTFISDGNATGTGSALSGGVTVTTASSNEINGWSTAPAYTNGSGASLTNFNNLMHDIRWSNTATSNLSINISGLTPGNLYNVQLLFGENNPAGTGTRTWDIGVEGNLEADNLTMAGATPSTASLGRAFTGNFDPGADGILSIIMDDDLGGAANTAADRNPILQAVIVHAVPIPEPSGIILSLLGCMTFLLRRRR